MHVRAGASWSRVAASAGARWRPFLCAARLESPVRRDTKTHSIIFRFAKQWLSQRAHFSLFSPSLFGGRFFSRFTTAEAAALQRRGFAKCHTGRTMKFTSSRCVTRLHLRKFVPGCFSESRCVSFFFRFFGLLFCFVFFSCGIEQAWK